MSKIDFDTALAACPLVAILRGLTPAEAPAIGSALVEAGFTMIEVPLNSPEPYASIGILNEQFGDRALIGAGTVLTPKQAVETAGAGGRFMVSPNVNADTIRAAVGQGMDAVPGFFTPSEAFAALDAGARALKLFPAEGAQPAMLKAMRAVLPRKTKVLAVGGINAGNMDIWRQAGAVGFGLGSNLYKPGKSADTVAADARELVNAVRNLK